MATDTVTNWLPGGTATSLLIVLGVILFVVPEPITSVIGILVLLAGVAIWLFNAIL